MPKGALSTLWPSLTLSLREPRLASPYNPGVKIPKIRAPRPKTPKVPKVGMPKLSARLQRFPPL